MTLELFAQASQANPDFPTDGALDLKVELASRLADGLQSQRGDRWEPQVLLGAGLCLNPDYRTLYPTVLADAHVFGLKSDDIIPISDTPDVLEAVRIAVGSWTKDLESNVHVLRVSQGTLHSAPGSKILGITDGRVGPHVTFGAGIDGFLTAGHVAPFKGSQVTDAGGTLLGTVEWANDPSRTGASTPDIDVSVVRFGQYLAATTGRSTRTAGAGDMLDIAGAGTQSPVFAFFKHVTIGTAQASYAECYATQSNVAAPGDSGALVECHGDVAGILLGGFTGRNMTLVQDIVHVISEFKARNGVSISL